jgi:hypothetical protein
MLSDEEFLAELLKERSYLSVVTEKAVETLDSAFAAATKLIGKAPAKPVAVQKPKVVILGSGWPSHAYSRDIEQARLTAITCAVSFTRKHTYGYSRVRV